jgi:hypothetical protein
LLAGALLVGAFGYAFTRPALEVFDDLHDSEDESDDEERSSISKGIDGDGADVAD